MTDRRHFIRVVAAICTAIPLASRAQTTRQIYRVGILRPTQGAASDMSVGIPLALRNLGYAEGQNLVIDYRYADGHLDRLPGLARELVALKPDVILAVGSGAVKAAREATTTIPIVLYGNFDPVQLGLVSSLARPGGNVTGVLIAPQGTLAAKKLELLKETVPRAKRMALLAPDDPNFRVQITEVQQAATSLGIELVVVQVRGTNYDDAFARLIALRVGALFVGATTFFMVDRKPIIDLAARHRLPAIYEWPEQVVAGGLMSYGGNLSETYQRIASQIDRIIKGAKPAELPVEQPAKLKLFINLTTAKALGLDMPQSLLARADEVIQ